MVDNPPVVSPRGKANSAIGEKAAAWKRVARMAALSFGLAGAGALYQDGGQPSALAMAGGLGVGIISYVLLTAVSAARGLGLIAAFRDPKNCARVAAGFGVLCALLGGSGVYFHDGAPVGDALLTSAALGVVGFLAGYFPLLTWLASLVGLSSSN
ncbi:MAG: hypothetical protein ABL894_14315 [Hyphomicrobium sp.]